MMLLCLLVQGVGPAVFAQRWADTVAGIDKIVARYTNDKPGAELAITRNGQLLYSSVKGLANLEDGTLLTPESRLEAGSVSKQFTAACILLLEQVGRLSLSDDIRKYCPEVPDYGHVITIRHLMTHTSGIRDWGSVAEIAGWPRTSKAYSNDDALHIISQQKALNNVPGDEFIYSNSNYNLLAIIVQRTSGKSLAEYSREHIFLPAGMTHTEWRDDYKRIVPHRGVAYSRKYNGQYYTDMPNETVYGNGGLLTTAEDLVKWVDYYQHGRLGGPALLAKQLQPWKFNNGRTNIYTAGLFVDSIAGEPSVTHSGATAGYRANLEYFPRLGLTIAWLSNSSERVSTAVPGLVRDLFVPPLKTATAKAVAVSGATSGIVQHFIVVANNDTITLSGADTALRAEALQVYAGDYYSEEAEALMHVVVRNGRLMMFPRIGQEDFLRPVDKGVFLTEGDGYVRFLGDGFEISISRARKVRFRRLVRKD